MNTIKALFQSYGKKLDSLYQRQQRVFLNFVNDRINQYNLKIDNLAEIGGGIPLYYLLRSLVPKKSKKDLKVIGKRLKKSQLHVYKMDNTQVLLKFLREHENMNLTGVGASFIVKGDVKVILALLWTIICYYQLNIKGGGGREMYDKSFIKIMKWINSKFGKKETKINSIHAWKSGQPLLDLILCMNRKFKTDDLQFRNDIDQNKSDLKKRIKTCINFAFEKYNIPRLLKAEDFMIDPDELTLLTYLSYFKNAYKKEKKRLKKQMDATCRLRESLSKEDSNELQSKNNTPPTLPKTPKPVLVFKSMKKKEFLKAKKALEKNKARQSEIEELKKKMQAEIEQTKKKKLSKREDEKLDKALSGKLGKSGGNINVKKFIGFYKEKSYEFLVHVDELIVLDLVDIKYDNITLIELKETKKKIVFEIEVGGKKKYDFHFYECGKEFQEILIKKLTVGDSENFAPNEFLVGFKGREYKFIISKLHLKCGMELTIEYPAITEIKKLEPEEGEDKGSAIFKVEINLGQFNFEWIVEERVNEFEELLFLLIQQYQELM